jgi:serine/threonine protein kinase
VSSPPVVPSGYPFTRALREGVLGAHRIPGSHLGPYVMVDELARGGFGLVLRAIHRSDPARIVALKVLRSGAAAGGDQRRFEREAKLTHELRHPGIVQTLDWGSADGLSYLALEFIGGGTLGDAFEAGAEPEQVMVWMQQVARALGYAHARGIVHRDLKPANVLIRSGDSQPVVTDLGLGRNVDLASSLTKTGASLGTPAYMPPEQITGKEATPSADVFALGVMLYEGLTGTLPFRAPNIALRFAMIQGQTLEPATTLNPAIDPRLDQVIARALAPKPSDRYSDGDAFAEAIQEVLSSEPPAPSSGRKTRHLAILGTTLLGVGAVFTIFARGGPSAPLPLPPGPPGLPATGEPLPEQPPGAIEPVQGPVAPKGPFRLVPAKQILDAKGKRTFGRHVAAQGSTLVVSEFERVWVYTRDEAGSWEIAQELTRGSHPIVAEGFGYRLAIRQDTICVGAWGGVWGAGTTPPGPPGEVYVYRRSPKGPFALEARLVSPTPAGKDRFGFAVDVEDDTVVVGAYGDSTRASYAGAAFVYQRGPEGWRLEKRLEAPEADADANHQFGGEVAIDSGRIAVGANNDADAGRQAGAVYVFEDEGGWVLRTKLLPDPGDGARMGFYSLAMERNTILAGSVNTNRVYAWRRDSAGTWRPEAFETPAGHRYFGWRVAIRHGLVGISSRHRGVYFYRAGPQGWSLLEELADNGNSGKSFGWKVGMGGGTVAVAALGEGAVYVLPAPR